MYKDRPIFLVYTSIDESENIYTYAIQADKWDCRMIFWGKPEDHYWILYNYTIDGKAFMDIIEDCILEDVY